MVVVVGGGGGGVGMTPPLSVRAMVLIRMKGSP